MKHVAIGKRHWIVPPEWLGTSLENWVGALTAQGFDSSTFRMVYTRKCEVAFCKQDAVKLFQAPGRKAMWVCQHHLDKKLDDVHKRNRRS